tara:strand:- start:559 stop:1263 length:705 start_codon:yes stop_codon:yes gene_type:complete
MNEEFELETYLSISPNKFVIYLFDPQKIKILYKKEKVIFENSNSIDLHNLKEFLDSNIFKIEKLKGKFVENIFLVIQNDKILNLNFSIKKKNYNNHINKDYLENFLIEAKDLFKKNYQTEKIMHMIISKCYINGKSYSSVKHDLKCDYLILEFKFISIPDYLIDDLNNVLENYQIKVIKFLDGQYIKNFIKDISTDIPEIAHNILKGLNVNEIMIIPKNPRKTGFFEKFFQLFS